MRTILSSEELPQELEGFFGGMGFKSIASFTDADLDIDSDIEDVKGYISEPAEDGQYYAEVRSEDRFEMACGTLAEMQKWVTDTVYDFCTE